MAWNDGLTAGTPAHEIAASDRGRIRVLAGPGTGKSFAMKRRIARLLESGIDPAAILAVTFTRVAAEDLHRELSSMDVQGADGLSGRTVHSLAMSILLRNHVLPTLGRTPRPLNQFELDPLLEDLSARHGNKRQRARRIKAYEAGWARLQDQEPGFAADPADAAFAADLLDWLVLHEAMLIGEVIPQLHRYLQLHPAAPELAEFQHILIDEYQDLNKVEQEVLRLIGSAASVCVVGDDDQSIYSFKHAHPEGVREWTQVNGAEDHAIIDCRRCPTTVVRMANNLVGHNQNRVARPMNEFLANGPGDVQIRQYDTAEDEAEAVSRKIVELVDGGVAPGDIIVLAQRATFATPIFKRLRDAGIPAKSYYAEHALAGIFAQERFALLKLTVNPEDRVALRWLLGVGHARWNANSYGRITAHIRQTGETPNQVLAQLDSGDIRIPHTNRLVERYREVIAEVARLRAASKDLAVFANEWLPVPEMAPLLAEVMNDNLMDSADLPDLLDRMSVAITQPDVPDEVAEVRIMSLHKSKGLSSPFVFIAGCVEGLLPGAPDLTTSVAARQAKLEEDRRLFYVGITRVKASPDRGLPGYLALTYPSTMDLADARHSQIVPVANQGRLAILQASRFMGEFGQGAPRSVARTPL